MLIQILKILLPPPHQQVYVNKQHVDKQRINKQRGFTIIEVALVLAIAGLIFLVVFLALPALQNSQKDTARKQDVARIVSALQGYMADNQGNSPTAGAWYKTDGSTTSGFSGYIGKLSQVTIVGVWSDAVGFSAAQTRFNDAKNGIYYNNVPYDGVVIGHTCSDLGTSGTSGSSSSTDAAVWSILSNGTAYCVNM